MVVGIVGCSTKPRLLFEEAKRQADTLASIRSFGHFSRPPTWSGAGRVRPRRPLRGRRRRRRRGRGTRGNFQQELDAGRQNLYEVGLLAIKPVRLHQVRAVLQPPFSSVYYTLKMSSRAAGPHDKVSATDSGIGMNADKCLPQTNRLHTFRRGEVPSRQQLYSHFQVQPPYYASWAVQPQSCHGSVGLQDSLQSAASLHFAIHLRTSLYCPHFPVRVRTSVSSVYPTMSSRTVWKEWRYCQENHSGSLLRELMTSSYATRSCGQIQHAAAAGEQSRADCEAICQLGL
jgi:hypothetical protein